MKMALKITTVAAFVLNTFLSGCGQAEPVPTEMIEEEIPQSVEVATTNLYNSTGDFQFANPYSPESSLGFLADEVYKILERPMLCGDYDAQIRDLIVNNTGLLFEVQPIREELEERIPVVSREAIGGLCWNFIDGYTNIEDILEDIQAYNGFMPLLYNAVVEEFGDSSLYFSEEFDMAELKIFVTDAVVANFPMQDHFSRSSTVGQALEYIDFAMTGNYVDSLY